MSTLLRKRISAIQVELGPATIQQPPVPVSSSIAGQTAVPRLEGKVKFIDDAPPPVVAGNNNNNNNNNNKRKRDDDDDDNDEWSKDRIVHEYQKLMNLRVHASESIAEATNAHKRAVAASGSVAEQERSILAHAAKRAHKAFNKKQEALKMYVVQYKKSCNDAKLAFHQVKAAKSDVEAWNAKLEMEGSDVESLCVPDMAFHHVNAVNNSEVEACKHPGDPRRRKVLSIPNHYPM